MWVYQSFAEDANDTLNWIQHDLWFQRDDTHLQYKNYRISSCGFIFGFAKDVYLQKWKDGPLFYPEIEGLADKNSLDHRILQSAHNLIAAYYRWLVRHEEVPALASTPELYRRYLLERWIQYLKMEMESLADDSDDGIEAIVTAVIHGNTEKGYEAEDKLYEYLTWRYKGPFMDACEEWTKRAMTESERVES